MCLVLSSEGKAEKYGVHGGAVAAALETAGALAVRGWPGASVLSGRGIPSGLLVNLLR